MRHRFKLEDIEEAIEDGTIGFCIECGEDKDCVEPDAEEYECDACGKAKVYGAEQILMMGLVS